MVTQINAKSGARRNRTRSNLIKTGVFVSVKPTLEVDFTAGILDSRFTFSRADVTPRATYFDDQGIMRTAAVNLVTNSDNFAASTFLVNNGGTGTGGGIKTVNYGLAPDGTMTACRVQGDAGAGTTYSDYSGIRASVTCDLRSIWVKSNTGLPQQFSLYRPDANAVKTATTEWTRVYYYVSAGTVFDILAIGAVQRNIDILIWHPQAENGVTTPSPYISTSSTASSAPRIDHDPVTKQCLGLLLEESRTNAIRNSMIVGAVSGTPGTMPTNWTDSGAGLVGLTRTITTGNDVYGKPYIDIRYAGTSAGGTVQINCGMNADTLTVGASTAYTTSVWVSGTNLPAALNVGRSDEYLSTTYVRSSNGINIGSGTTAYTRVVSTATTGTGIDNVKTFYSYLACPAAAVDFTVRLSAPQMEVGAFATSFIPTTTTSLTRAVDSCIIQGAEFNAWYKTTSGTLVIEGDYNGSHGAGFQASVCIGTNTDRLTIYENGVTGMTGSVRYSGADSYSAAVTCSDPYRAALAYAVDDCRFSCNGTIGSADSAPTAIPVISNQINFGGPASTVAGKTQHIRKFAYYPSRLSNNNLISITL